MTKNKIFYSLSKYEITAIKEEILNMKDSKYLNIVISFSKDDFNKIYKLLCNLYTVDNKEYVESCIWETFICNLIIRELDKNELIYYRHDLTKELKTLNSFNLNEFIQNINNRSSIETVSNIIKNQISRKVIIHYFQNDIIIPIELQKIINSIFVSKLPFTNILYTTKNSLNSHFMHNGYWIKQKNSDIESWISFSNFEKANF